MWGARTLLRSGAHPKRGCSTAGRSYHLFGAYRLRTQGNGTLVGFGKPLGCTFFHSLGHFRVRNKAQGSHPQRSGETAARVRGSASPERLAVRYCRWVKEKFATESKDGTPMSMEFKELAEFLQGLTSRSCLMHLNADIIHIIRVHTIY